MIASACVDDFLAMQIEQSLFDANFRQRIIVVHAGDFHPRQVYCLIAACQRQLTERAPDRGRMHDAMARKSASGNDVVMAW